MGSLAGLVGFDAADRLGGGPPDGPGVLVGEIDGDDLGGDVDGDDLPGVDAAEAGWRGCSSTGLLRPDLVRCL